jgi:hypothetical protein
MEGDILVLKLRDDFWQPPSTMNLPRRDPNLKPDQRIVLKSEMEINPKFRALSNQIQKLIGQDL